MQISIEQILERNYGIKEPFDEKGSLTLEGPEAYNKLIAVLADVGDFFNTNIENWINTLDEVIDSEKSELIRQNAKIFTFRVTYINEWGREKEIEFCAVDREEAVDLFNVWCINDEKCVEPLEMLGVRATYNEDDHKEYGINYGLPYEYEDNHYFIGDNIDDTFLEEEEFTYPEIEKTGRSSDSSFEVEDNIYEY